MYKFETMLISAATSIVTLIIVSVIFWISNWQQFLAFGFSISGIVAVLFGLLYEREPDGYMIIDDSDPDAKTAKVQLVAEPDEFDYYILKVTQIDKKHPL